MIKLYTFPSAVNYQKALARLQKSIRSGQFKSYTQQKKQQVWNRICRYARQLGISIKSSIAAACFTAGLCFASPAKAQTFALQTGTANPFNGQNIRNNAPAFIDIDGDGDLDAFFGAYDGTISYYKNTGTSTAPVFALQIGAANPLNGVNVSGNATPAFVDIDGDGDMDVFIGSYDGTISYYKNTGTVSIPVFTLQTGGTNPLNGINIGYYTTPAFVDIDGDGDMDVFIGSYYGAITYYKNTGTPSSPVFTAQTGASNPLNSAFVGYFPAPTFVDVDNDGDIDAFIGSYDGTISYYKNTGTASTPVFTLQTNTANPFDGVNVGNYATPAFADIDGDGDMDAFIGSVNGDITYYKNTTINLPLHLLSFSGSRHNDYNQLEWKTAAELNTKQFEIEQSNDGRRFTKIATVNTTGNGNNNYSIRDNAVYSGKVFYRLKMVDIDARFTYSPIIWIDSKLAGVIIYPNPVTDVVNINIGNATLLKTIAGIYDANGRLTQTILINTNQQPIDVQKLAQGMYIIKFADGKSQSFIKN